MKLIKKFLKKTKRKCKKKLNTKPMLFFRKKIKRTLWSFLHLVLLWFFCTTPSMINAIWVLFSEAGVRLNEQFQPNLFGIETPEMLIYIISFLGPIIGSFVYTLIKEGKTPNKWVIFNMLFSVAGLIFAVVAFCKIKSNTSTNLELMLTWIFVLYLISLCLWFTHIYHQENPPDQNDLDNIQRQEFEDTAKNYLTIKKQKRGNTK